MGLRTEPLFLQNTFRWLFVIFLSWITNGNETEANSFLPSFLPYLITYLLTHLFYLSSARTILSKLAGLKYYKCFSRSSLCHTMLSSPLLYHTTLYYTILRIKAYVMPVASQCCKVKFITKGPTTSFNQRIWYKIHSKF